MQSAIEANVQDSGPVASRGKWFWVMLALVAVSQFVAFWLLCNQQVRKGEERRAALQVQQVALADCLQSMRGSAIATCRVRTETAQETTTVITPVAGAMSVGFTYR